ELGERSAGFRWAHQGALALGLGLLLAFVFEFRSESRLAAAPLGAEQVREMVPETPLGPPEVKVFEPKSVHEAWREAGKLPAASPEPQFRAPKGR
ncbi:MAG: hypothetical protein KDB53_13780, partial [Planctomycetes bacterium]|nr:hypothetical protein [Planctomycetota bacterium]